MLKAAYAYSSIKEAQSAAKKLASDCDDQLTIYRPQVGILYSSFPHDKETLTKLLERLTQHYPRLTIIGCTVIAGSISNSGYKKEGYYLNLLTSDDIHMHSGMLENLSESQKNHQLIASFNAKLSSLNLPEAPNICITYPEYNSVDGEQLLNSLQEVLGKECAIFGGFSCDFWSDEVLSNHSSNTPLPINNTLQFYADSETCIVTHDAMPYLLLSGDIDFTCKYSFGWSDDYEKYPIKTDQNLIITIDDMDAVSFLQRRRHPLVSSSQGVIEYPFWIHEHDKEPYLRDFIIGTNGLLHSLRSTIPNQAQISFSYPNQERILKEYREVIHQLPNNYDIGFNFSCASRLMTLGTEIENETTYCNLVHKNTPMMTAYLFGEFFPDHTDCESMLHSCSSLILFIRSKTSNLQQTQPSDFMEHRIDSKNREIQDLKKQLNYFEKNQQVKENDFLKDILGTFLAKSNQSVSSFAEELQQLFKNHYNEKKPTYPLSRNRIIERLQPLKRNAQKKFDID